MAMLTPLVILTTTTGTMMTMMIFYPGRSDRSRAPHMDQAVERKGSCSSRQCRLVMDGLGGTA